MGSVKQKKFYAVKKGRNPGVYDNWPECHAQVEGFSGAVYKSFLDLEEALAFVKAPDRPKRSTKYNAYVNESAIATQESHSLSPDALAKIEECLDAICGTMEVKESKHDGFRVKMDEFLPG